MLACTQKLVDYWKRCDFSKLCKKKLLKSTNKLTIILKTYKKISQISEVFRCLKLSEIVTYLKLYVALQVLKYGCSPSTGCGYDDECRFEDTCTPDRLAPKGYRCQGFHILSLYSLTGF